MRKIFWDNPYQTDLETRVASVDNNTILFEETIAFSFSGGQESDHAYVNGLPVIDSKIEDNFIYYVLQDEHNLKPGDVVTMKIDWPRRYRLMRLHFAADGKSKDFSKSLAGVPMLNPLQRLVLLLLKE